MQLSSDKSLLAESKVLILYILYKANKPLTNEEFLKLVLSVTDMNYFYFQQFLLDLLNTKYVISYKKVDLDFYEITEQGIAALELTKDMIPGIMKLKVDSNFDEEMDIIENEISVSAEYMPLSENDYKIKCKVFDNGETIFELKTFAGSSEQAQKIVNNWNNNATKIYPQILALLDSEE